MPMKPQIVIVAKSLEAAAAGLVEAMGLPPKEVHRLLSQLEACIAVSIDDAQTVWLQLPGESAETLDDSK